MSSVFIEERDDLFTGLMEWMAMQTVSTNSRNIKAVTRKGQSNANNSADPALSDIERDDEVLDESGIFNFGKWAAKITPRYEPYYGQYYFWHNGRLFIFKRARESRSSSFLLTV